MSWEAWGDPPEYPCEVCGHWAHDCICPECPTCGAAGDPACYAQHGLVRSEAQIRSAIQHSPDEPSYDPATDGPTPGA
jgi:hypothetical protein